MSARYLGFVCYASLLAQAATAATPISTASLSACSSVGVNTTVPSAGTGVQLRSYQYCGGNLSALAYIENTNYNKIVKLYYADGDGKVTPLSILQLGYVQSVSGSNFEEWSALAQYANLDGIQSLVNITYQDVDADKLYSETLGIPVKSSGPKPTTSTIPKPYASPTSFAKDISGYTLPNRRSNVGFAKKQMFNNIFANATVIAAQSYSAPDYAYDWVRDSSLTFDIVEQFYEASTGGAKKNYASLIFKYAKGRAEQQLDPNLKTGLGEPKYNLNGSVYTGPWGRPQNDGAATSAIALINFANAFLKSGGAKSQILKQIWDSTKYPTSAPVKKDLLFVAQNWTSPSFDAWEEVESDHFYNKMVQYRALRLGAKFARSIGDGATASTLDAAASGIEAALPQFWNKRRNLILYSYGPVILSKYSYKDIAVLLGVNHGYNGDGVFAHTDDRMLATAVQIATSFIPVYKVSNQTKNSNGLALAPPIGRYPEDVYDGVGTSRGNPWYMTTATVAEYLYRTALAFETSKKPIVVSDVSLPFWTYFAPAAKVAVGRRYAGRDKARLVQALHGWGDLFLRTVQYYTPADGRLSEEFDRDDGTPRGAPDLTWSYASLLSASMARADAAGDSSYRRRLANL